MSGTRISGTIRSSWEVFFFIMNDAQFNLAGAKCVQFVSSDKVFASGAITSYALDWTAQKEDKYHFILLNRSTNDASVSVTFWTQT